MSFIGNVKILGTMKKFPAGAMVIPLLIGCTINTFFPDLLTIGGFTSGLFKNGIPTLIGLYLFCSGATIDVKAAGSTVYKGVVLTALKFFVGFGLGLLLNAIFGEAGFIGLLPLAVIGAVTNSNGVIYATLAGEYGDESDVGATAILTLNDGPFFTMIALGTAGLGNFPLKAIMASIVPLIIGFIIGNLDHEWREILSSAMALLPPFNGFCLGAGMSFLHYRRCRSFRYRIGTYDCINNRYPYLYHLQRNSPES
jgi:2-keto-3-deoxygluconate permease